MIRVTREDFESFKRHNDPEVFTQTQINSWVAAHQETLLKAETDEINEIEKAEVEAFNAEFSSFIQVEVVGRSSDLLTKSLEYERFYVREKRVEFEKAEGEEIEKSRRGKYTNTAFNRKQGRVGQQYGGIKQEGPAKEDDGSGKPNAPSKEEGSEAKHSSAVDYNSVREWSGEDITDSDINEVIDTLIEESDLGRNLSELKVTERDSQELFYDKVHAKVKEVMGDVRDGLWPARMKQSEIRDIVFGIVMSKSN